MVTERGGRLVEDSRGTVVVSDGIVELAEIESEVDILSGTLVPAVPVVDEELCIVALELAE